MGKHYYNAKVVIVSDTAKFLPLYYVNPMRVNINMEGEKTT